MIHSEENSGKDITEDPENKNKFIHSFFKKNQKTMGKLQSTEENVHQVELLSNLPS